MRLPVALAAVLAGLVSCPLPAADPPAAAGAPAVVRLWPGQAPDEPGDIGAEYVRPSPKLDRTQVEVTNGTYEAASCGAAGG